ncbi:MAG: glycoside hydrolase family 31 protein [Pseudomonadota bacterium]|nr:glycoside hydrolase family 31 protein [Pseudomonadota bacterium]
MNSRTRAPRHRRSSIWLCIALACAPIAAIAAAPAATASATASQAIDQGIEIPLGPDTVSVRLLAPGIVHVQFKPAGGVTGEPSLVIDRQHRFAAFDAQVTDTGNDASISAGGHSLHWDRRDGQLVVADAQHAPLLRLDLAALAHGEVSLQHGTQDALYGIGGYDATERAGAGMLREGTQVAIAGEQGHAGAPFVWSTAGYGVLVDTLGADFTLKPGRIVIDHSSRKDVDCYILLGDPAQLFDALAQISGHSPLFPKWAMGFTNSQWGIDQKELVSIVDSYRSKHIPIDNFTLDFDWKAWGEDNDGEFRWNPVKFPDGPNGVLARQMLAQGLHITGIMKPRIHVDTVEGRYATAHDFWVAGEKVSDDYFSHKPVKNINFDLPAARRWFGDLAVKYGFDEGIAGWWNDEADTTGSDTEFMNMQRALYDAQRAVSDVRVWSINRNFYLGAQRYAYGLWSGDIPTGFASMAGQRQRMLSAINVGAMQWGMDGGGFKGHPSDENYARWIEFGAFTPIFRVHGTFDEKRQPWVYGPIAEKAATDAIRLRYALIPYIYSYEYRRHLDGVGLVRPLLFDWPHDTRVANDVDSWLFGDYLLVSPVVQQGQTRKDIYLPAGRWTDWFSGRVYQGGQRIQLAIDSKGWGDIPLFVRAGAIIPTQPAMDYVGEKPLTEVGVEVFPSEQRSRFDYYDDDGSTYAYEHGAYFSQTLAVQRHADTVRFDIGAASGTFRPALRYYLLKIHGATAGKVAAGGELKAFDSLQALQGSAGEGWARGKDRFGPVTYVRVDAATARHIALTWGH